MLPSDRCRFRLLSCLCFDLYSVFSRTFAAITFGGLHIGRATAFAPDFTKAKLAAARLFQYMDTKPKIDISANEDGQVVSSPVPA